MESTEGPRPLDDMRRLARAWWWLGLLALIGAGLGAALQWSARAAAGLWPWPAVADAAGVVHTTLAATLWPLAMTAAMWTALGTTRAAWLGWAGLASFGAGAALVVATPFLPGVRAAQASYLPEVGHPGFGVALALCGGGFLLVALRAMATVRPRPWFGDPLRGGAWLAALAGVLAMLAFFWSWLRIPVIEERIYFEVLWWGGGHTLQFQHALMAVVAWAWVVQANGGNAPATARARSAMFGIAALPLLGVPLIYLGADAGTLVHMEAFAQLMVWGHPYMLPLVVVAAVSAWRLRRRAPGPALAALAVSIALFVAGGALGYGVGGGTAIHTAHVNGMSAAVTLAFVGLAFVLSPRLGYGLPQGRSAIWSPWLIGGGQLVQMAGLAWAGHQGLLRATAGAAPASTSPGQSLGVGIAAFGGLIALAGLAAFIAACLRAMEPTCPPAKPSSGPTR